METYVLNMGHYCFFTCSTFYNQCHPVPRSQCWVKIIGSYYKTGMPFKIGQKKSRDIKVKSVRWGRMHVPGSSSQQSKANNCIKLCLAEAKVCCWLSKKKSKFPSFPWHDGWRQKGSGVGISTCPQSDKPLSAYELQLLPQRAERTPGHIPDLFLRKQR